MKKKKISLKIPRSKVIFFLWVLIFILLKSAYAQSWKNIRFERISLEQGLSQATINCIMQDNQGFMWFGTQDGLNKYDGYTFTVYRNDPENRYSLSANWINVIYEDTQGNMWIGTNGGGLNQLDQKTGKFTSFQTQPDNPHSISHNDVRYIYEDSNENVWISTSKGLNQLDRKTGKFIRFQHRADNPHSISNNKVWPIFEDSAGNFWIGTLGGGLNRLDRKTGKFTRIQTDTDNFHSLSHSNVMSILEDSSGNLWIGTSGDGLNQLDRKTGKSTRFLSNGDSSHNISNKKIRTILEDSEGCLWIGTEGGLIKFNTKTGSFTRFLNQVDNPYSISQNNIWTLFEDSVGYLWIGTKGGGINKFDQRTARFALWQNQSDNPQSLSSNKVWSIFEDSLGNMWIGTEGGGLNNFDIKTGIFTHYKNQPNNPHCISHNIVWSIFEDSLGNMWIGTGGGGLNRFDRKTEKFTSLKHQPDNPHSISNNHVWSILEDSLGDFWIGTLRGGLNKLDRKTGKFIHYQHQPDNPHSISHNVILSTFEDSLGNLWIGTGGGGLNRLDRKTGKFIHFKNQADNPHSISHNNVKSIVEDSNGNLWICTNGGLNKFDMGAGIFTHFREKHGLPSDVIYGILEDGMNNLWLSTNKGISKFNPKKGIFTNYDEKDGLQSNEFNAGAFYKDKSGRMYFGGINGFNEFYPDQIRDNTFVPPVAITDFLLFNKPVPIAGAGIESEKFQLQQHINFAKKITLNYTDYIFAFEFSALNYRQSEKNQFAYKLEGLDRVWIETDYQHRRATYTNVPDGEYVFRVKASNDDGYWNEEGASIQLIILPPPWKTWWAYTLYLMALISLVFWFIQSQRKKVYQKQKELDREKQFSTRLEKEVQDRTAEVVHQKEELENAYQTVRSNNQKLEEANLKLEKLTVQDGLTGIANKRRFGEFYNNEWRRMIRYARPISIIMIDIDYFKLYNDTHGHQMGDECLKKVAKVLVDLVTRPLDIVARYGGEEFVVVLPETASRGARVVAEKMRTGVESLKLIHEKSKVAEHVTISLGCATTIPKRGEVPAALINAADKSLYLSKQNGRNQTSISNV